MSFNFIQLKFIPNAELIVCNFQKECQYVVMIWYCMRCELILKQMDFCEDVNIT